MIKDAGSKPTELAKSRVLYAVLFSMLSPFVGYSYTGRFKALGIFLAGSVAVLIGVSYAAPEPAIRSKRVQISIGLGIGAIAAADNSRAILSVRRKVENLEDNS